MDFGASKWAEDVTTEPTKTFHSMQAHSESFQNSYFSSPKFDLDQILTK